MVNKGSGYLLKGKIIPIGGWLILFINNQQNSSQENPNIFSLTNIYVEIKK